ncbi:GMC oxidoreductase [Aliiglaciecola lipolytica]|uniref:Glucose-methanol-choline oxidoreductase n=1 Tax=Aliiglaciecola lipolytica E3 TaxID=1127673 RepID=K6YJ08_9ALTE|nr:GMC family oxidoreductase [Aliiglaciecola lipolytica]GAC16608.1 glucose-methanol-choline oxidoreductase [Aliiglaciecola lipolytica E3]
MNKDMYIKEQNNKFDVLIVGSGITGGWAAKEFCERGFKTLMIERGRVVEHRKDYISEGKPVWDYANRTKVDNLLVEQQHKIQKDCYAFHDGTKHFFGNDRDLPYETSEKTDFRWIRANQLGGKSLLWHRQSYRMCADDFLANKRDGVGIDWPIRYHDLAEWYSYVEKFVGVSGSKENLPNLPDGEFQAPFAMRGPEKALKAAIEKAYPGRSLIMGRAAHLTEPTMLHMSQGRVQCQARNECQKGCSFGAYFSTQSSTLPAAAETNNLSIAANSVVHSLIYDEKRNRVIGVRVIDNDDLSTREYFADVVFLCASTIGSTQIMLNSTSKTFPNGIANSSGVLGHYLMDHNYNAVARGDLDGFEDEYYKGRRPSSCYMPNYQTRPELYRKGYLRGFAYGIDTYRGDWRGMSYQDGIGSDYKDQLSKPGKWGAVFAAQGEMLPHFDNQMSLHPTKKDKWGIPQIVFDVQYRDNEKAMMDDAAQLGAEMLAAGGCTNIKSSTSYELPERAPGIAIHEVGTARMGRDPKTSVLNQHCQSHDIPNLFVTDGSGYCSSGVVNPSLTFMALTARAVDYCAKEIKAQRL